MLSGLRLRLTLLYILAACALLVLVGGGSYLLLGRYFEHSTDLALRHKMAHEFALLGAPLPPDLQSADRDWSILRAGAGTAYEAERAEEQEDEGQNGEATGVPRAIRAYDGDLAAIFVLPLNTDGQLLFNPNPFSPPVAPDTAALESALAVGADWRTVQTVDGTRVRLLTYRLSRDDGPAALQLGRALDDQDRVLGQVLFLLIVLGVGGAALIGLGSWLLAGRAVVPAQHAWARQQAFIANASHELRAPLALMRASAEVVLRELPEAQPEQRAILDDLLQESDHMSRLVDDLLLLSRLDAGRLELVREPIDLGVLLPEVGRQVGRLAAERKLALDVARVSGVVLGDVARLRQVLLIVLDNAVRYTPCGGTIRLSATPAGRWAVIEITDTGVGIDPAQLPNVFERFYRGDSAHTRRGDGAGLGLSIARGLIEAMHGRITLASQPGQGTTVTIMLAAAGSGTM